MYTANPDRYETMQYKRVGRSGLKLPYVSLGLWHNFGSLFPHSNSREMGLDKYLDPERRSTAGKKERLAGGRGTW